MMLSRAGVVVESMLAHLKRTAQGQGTPTYKQGKRENNKRKKRENKLYAQQRHKQHDMIYMLCNPSVLPKHIKNIFISFTQKISSLLVYNSKFSFYVHFTILFGLLFQLTHTHTKITFSHFKVMSVFLQDTSSESSRRTHSGG